MQTDKVIDHIVLWLREYATKAVINTAKKSPTNAIAVGAAGGAAATIIAFMASKLYKNYISKHARNCKGKPDKVACMRSIKNKAFRMRLDKLKSGMSICGKAKNPDGCKKSLQNKISSLQKRIDKI